MHPKCAAVAGKGPEGVWGSIAAKLESSKARKCPLAGLAVDLKKCFDLVPRHLSIRVHTEVGAEPRLTPALELFYTSTQKRVRIGTALGESFTPTSSIIQGGPLARLLLSGVFTCSFYLLEAEPGALADGFVDDANLTTIAPDSLRRQRAGRTWVTNAIQKSVALVRGFGTLTKQMVIPKKTLL